MKVKGKHIRRRVQILKNPRPSFVSLVDHPATQTPWAAVKSKDGVRIMANRLKKTKKGASTAAKKPKTLKKSANPLENQSQSSGVFQIAFDADKFTSETAVKAWLDRHQWEDYDIEKKDGEFVVSSTLYDRTDFADIHEVTVDAKKGISAFVGRLLDDGDDDEEDKASKARQTDADAANMGDDEDDNSDDADEDADDSADGDDDADDNGDEDDDSEDQSDEEDEADESDENADDSEEDDDDASDDEKDDEDDSEDSSDEEDDGEDEVETEGDDADDEDPRERETEGDDPDPYANRKGSDGKTINDREKGEPDPLDLPGQSLAPTGRGKPGHEPGGSGKFRRFRKSVKKGNKTVHVRVAHSNSAIDDCIRKYDYYNAYLSGGMSLKDVLSDGMTDGVPPGVSQIFEAMYKSVGNVLKSSDEVSQDIGTIASEFSEAVLALHDVWKGLLKEGTKEQKAAAKKYFADLGEGELQTSAKSTKSVSAADIQTIVAEAVAKAVKPVQQKLDTTTKSLERFKKGIPARKSLDSDDETGARIRRTEEQDDELFLRDLSSKSLFGVQH